MRVLAEQQFGRDAFDHEQFAHGLERAVAWQVRRLERKIILGLGSARRRGVVAITPVGNRGENLRRKAAEFGEGFGFGRVDVEAAFLVAHAIDDAAAFVLSRPAEDAEFSATQRDFAELLRRVVKFAGVIFPAAAAFVGVAVEQRLGFFNARHREVMCLDAVAVIFLDHQVHPRRVQHGDHHERQERHAPEQADQDRSLLIVAADVRRLILPVRSAECGVRTGSSRGDEAQILRSCKPRCLESQSLVTSAATKI